MISYAAVLTFVLLVAAAAAGDAFSLRIPNWLTLLIALLFIPFALAAGMPWPALGFHLLAGLVFLLAGFALFAAGLFGGGDAKLMAASALWIGWPGMLHFLFWTALSGSLLALLILIYHLAGRRQPGSKAGWRKLPVPYGVALFAGTVLALPYSWWLSALP